MNHTELNVVSTEINIKTPRYKKIAKWTSLLFVLPALLLNLIFFVYPLIQSFIMSFYDVAMLGPRKFVGLDNYMALMQDTSFWNAMWFTLKYILMVTPPIFIVGLLLALTINKKLPGTTFFRSVYFLPVVISMVSSSLVWLWGYNDLNGLINYYLMKIGIIDQPVVWMGQASTSLPAICFMVTWKVSGFTMILLLSGLQSIPQEVYEASKMDGASRWQTFQYITLPLLKPSIVLSLVVSVIGSALAFEQFVVMTQGGPANSTTTIVNLIYDTSFKYFKFGYGASMTMVLMIILLILSTIQVRVVRKNK
jgi:multiple sugar transport system permease protein